jgi:hypothetical protein
VKNITKALILVYVILGTILLLGAVTPATEDTQSADKNWQQKYPTLPYYPTPPVEPLPDNPDPTYPLSPPDTPDAPEYNKFVY